MNSFSPRSSHPAQPLRLDTSLIGAQRQNVWGRLAVINFTLGSAGAGLYLLSTWLEMLPEKFLTASSLSVVRVIAAGCVCLGLMAVAGEAGRPLRARFLLGNLRRSWMSRESLAAMVFVPFAVLSALIHSPFASGAAAVAAVIFILSQGFILYRSRAVAAWNTPILPALFVTSALVSGSGLWLALPSRVAVSSGNTALLIATVVISSADLLLWTFYLYWPASDAFQATTQSLRSGRSMLWSIGVGRVWPTMIVMLPLVIPDTLTTSGWSLTIAGLALFVGSWTQKSGIIRACGYLRPIGLQLQVSRPASFKTSAVVSCNRL